MGRLLILFVFPMFVVVLCSAAGAALGQLWIGMGIGVAAGVLAAVALEHRVRGSIAELGELTVDPEQNLLRRAMAVPGDDVFSVTQRTIAQQTLQRDNMAQAIRQRIAQQAQVLDQMNDGLMRLDEEERVTWANVAAGSMFGGRNPTGRTFMSVVRDHELMAAVHACLTTGIEQSHTLELPGEGRLISVVMISLSQHPPDVLVTFRDITEINRLQHLRRDFVANVSHELRTPLSTIKILTETLLDIREDDDEAAAFLNKIDNEVDSMTALVRDLLDLTRLETAGGRLQLRDIEIAQLVHDVHDRMRPLAERHSVQLFCELPDELGFMTGDERRLHQALINLITNAIVHTPADGSVTVGAERMRGQTVMFVRDTGSGIPPADLPRVWERFFKTDRARTGPGTGLGLAIVKHIVQSHGGTVMATSQLGQGSEFRITIPNSTSLRPRALARIADEPFAPNS